MEYLNFPGRLVMLGFGSMGQGVLPLILRHIAMPKERIIIVSAAENGAEIANQYGVRFVRQALTRDNYKDVLTPILGAGDFLVNLSVDVSSVALIGFAREVQALYLDTCIEPWAGGYTDLSLSPSERSNYALRESALALRRGVACGSTAVLTHGANPGLVSHFVKEALLTIARDTGAEASVPRARKVGGACRRARRQGDPHCRARHPDGGHREASRRVR
jgi:homospermidine synthase